MSPGRLSSYSDLEAALLVIIGAYGNGQARRNALGSRYDAVQGLVEQILNTGKVPDGTGTDPEKLKKAMNNVYYDVIQEVTNEVIERIK